MITLIAFQVDNDYDRYDKEKDKMPYDKEKDEMPYDKEKDKMPYDKEKDKMSHENDNDNRLYDIDYDNTPDDSDNDQMSDKYADDYEIALERVKYDRNMTNDELKDVGTKDVVIHQRDDRMTTKVRRSIETNDIDDDFKREYDEMHKLMQYKQIYDFYEAQRHIQSTMEVDTPIKTSQNRQCIDNVRDYDREHDRILNSVRHRLDLGPNML